MIPSLGIQKLGFPPLRLIAAPFTPFGNDGSLALDKIENYCELLHNNFVAGVFICGTTGEGMSLTIEERKSVAEAWHEAAVGKLDLIVHVGHTSLEESCRLARHAEEIGAKGIATIGPVFYPPASPDAWVEYCRRIASMAPNTDFYYYHMPSMSKIGLNASDLLPSMQESIPNFKGIKFTHEDLADYKKCLSLSESGCEIFFGRDELLLEGLKLGASSAVGSTYNFAAPIYLNLARLYQAGKIADATACQNICIRAIESMIRHGGLAGIRATLELCGLDCGPMRLPLVAISRKQLQSLNKELQAMGYFDLIRDSRIAFSNTL
jgi:N-acetylneuraminate lyase